MKHPPSFRVLSILNGKPQGPLSVYPEIAANA